MTSPGYFFAVSTAIYLFLTFFNICSGQDSGPYKIILETIKNCNDKGTGEMSFTFNSREGEEGVRLHSGVMKLVYGINDNLQAEGDASIRRNGEWKPIGLIWKLPFSKACSGMKSLTPGFFAIIDKSNAESSECPIKKGSYQVTDYSVTEPMQGADTLKYGHYRIRLSFTKNRKKIGCICYIAEVVPA